MPATPASRWTITSVPSSSARTCASRTAGSSDVPPETIVTRPCVGGHVARHPREPRALVLVRVGRDLEQRGAGRGVRARDHHAPGAGLQQRGGDRR